MKFTCRELGRQGGGFTNPARTANGADVERYAYDRAGNMVRKSIRIRSGAVRSGSATNHHESPRTGIRDDSCQFVDDSEYVTTTYAFDGANQLVSSTCDGVTTRYAYDAAGRLVSEGEKTYRYGYLDKVLSVTDGNRSCAYAYHVDGQLARADYGDGRSEGFAWDGLALVRRGGEQLLNEPHAGGGSPVLSSSGTAYFSDILGTTLGEKGRGRRYAAARQTAFGAGDAAYFTGKPQIPGLGRVFLYRNYRADLAKWQTADPLGYPDGWNQLAYCGNEVTRVVDLFGAMAYDPAGLTSNELDELNRALSIYSIGGVTVGGLFDGRPLTRSFFFRYIWKLGDQELAYSEISGEKVLQEKIRAVVRNVKNGKYDSGGFSIAGSAWASMDLSGSLGGVYVSYWVEDILISDGGMSQLINFSINDPYDFHDKGVNANLPGLSALWGGGDEVYDVWLMQLAARGNAKVFNTHIAWRVMVE